VTRIRVEGGQARGVELASGQYIPADIVVTATGLDLLGFGGMALRVDGKAVDTERAACAAVAKEFGEPLGFGIVDPMTQIPALNKALQAAGIDRIRAEMQKQIDVWMAAKKR
jgi:cation diffusion facilitator CzcD-associated flavoprotein CzcO